MCSIKKREKREDDWGMDNKIRREEKNERTSDDSVLDGWYRGKRN